MAMTTTVEKLLAKASELEQQAVALRIAAAFLGDTATAEKVVSTVRRVSKAVALRKAQTNGHALQVEEEIDVPAPRTPRLRGKRAPTGSALATQRAAKRDQVLAIIRDYGKPMPIKVLTEAARERGIASLTGMISYVRAGYLHKTGSRGKTRYTFRALPEGQE